MESEKKTVLRMNHQYSRKLLTSKRCDHCQKAMLFVGLRCKDCRFKCHRKCAKVSQHRCQHVVQALQVASATAARASQRLRQWVPSVERRKRNSAKASCGGFTTMPTSVTDSAFGEDDSARCVQSSANSANDSADCTVLNDSMNDEVFVDSGIHTPLNLTSLRDHGSQSSYSSSYCSCPRSSVASIPHQNCTCLTESCICPRALYDNHQEMVFTTPPTNKDLRSVATRTRNLSATRSCPPKVKQSGKLHLCSTWPTFNSEELDCICSSGLYDWQQELDRQQFPSGDSDSICNKLQEWKINYSDLEFGQRLKQGKNTTIYRGRWHGDVIIHTYQATRNFNEFLEEVAVLSRIRHENIELFMGVSLEPTNMAVVTSEHKGASLFEHVHLKGERMFIGSKINVARQIAQGMGYLHAMGVHVGSKLNSRNIFMESKVKLCLLGFDVVEQHHIRDDVVCLPKGHLTYMAPEIMRTLQIENGDIINDTPCNTMTDSFAFGTVMYELFSGSWPFHGEYPHTVMWKFCNGEMPSLSPLDCPVHIKGLINDCWSDEPLDRPKFTDIAKELQHNVSLHKKHSQSNPENLNRIGRPSLSSPTHLRGQWR
ncbi:kinase suppressor of Ras 2-like isoform X2 [Ptychodera flava]|uniref:kinase suppressor of Ras 2-like isoform X2 n=1 Tax=Ptychodera flava TaxID=63121 RepID=UPI00396A643F